ncbi:MAG TPA: 3-carboxy-cis,cis-muconate cycloisomerase, partial [Caulobacteraceae bacterium]
MSASIRDRAASTPEMIVAFGDATLLRAALAFEAALAEAQAAEGLVDQGHAAAISQACRQAVFDPEALAEAAAHAGTLAIPLVADLRERVAQIEP